MTSKTQEVTVVALAETADLIPSAESAPRIIPQGNVIKRADAA